MMDLWPKEIGTVKIKSPVAILREQASLLGQKTKNIVTAEVSEGDGERGTFSYFFHIVAPALGNYRYKLLSISHEISLYPLEVNVEDAIFDEIDNTLKNYRDESEFQYLVADSEEKFIKILRAVLGSKKSFQVITALLSQSDENWTPDSNVKPDREDLPF